MSEEIQRLKELVEHWKGEAEIQLRARMRSEEALRVAEEKANRLELECDAAKLDAWAQQEIVEKALTDRDKARAERDEAIALNKAAALLLNKGWERKGEP